MYLAVEKHFKLYVFKSFAIDKIINYLGDTNTRLVLPTCPWKPFQVGSWCVLVGPNYFKINLDVDTRIQNSEIFAKNSETVN